MNSSSAQKYLDAIKTQLNQTQKISKSELCSSGTNFDALEPESFINFD